jgi:hypothetical protein
MLTWKLVEGDQPLPIGFQALDGLRGGLAVGLAELGPQLLADAGVSMAISALTSI